MPAHAPAGSVPQHELTKPHPDAYRPRAPGGTTSRWENHVLWVQRTHWQGEMRMWATVLADVVRVLRQAPRDSSLWREARDWVCEGGDTIQHFDGVCTELDLDADYVRADLLRRYTT